MKKMVRLLSVIMVITMMFSMMASAFADNGFVIAGGSSNAPASGNRGNGSGTSISANTKPSYYTTENGKTATSTELDVSGTAEAPRYLGNGDIDYEDLVNSRDPNIANNADFIMYIHDNLDNVSLNADGTIATAYGLFGADIIEGTEETEKTESAKADPETCEHEWVEATCTAARHCSKCGTSEGEPLPHSFVTNENDIKVCTGCGKTYCEVNGHAWVDNGDGTQTCPDCHETQGSHVHEFSNATCTEPEKCSCGAVRGDALDHAFVNGTCIRCGAADPEYTAPVQDAEPSAEPDNEDVTEEAEETELAAKAKVIHAQAISYKPGDYSNNSVFSSDCGSSLISALASGAETITLSKAFDICNSTEYRITIDLNGKTIVAPAGDAAFVIRKSTTNPSRSTVTFTNGILKNGGFYVCENGVLNLGGLININGLDILVDAGNNFAVYVDDSGTAVFGQGTDLRSSGEDTVYIKAGGQVRMSGGTVTCGSSNYAVNNSGTFLFNSTGSDLNNSYGVIKNENGVAVYAKGSSSTIIGAGTVIGQTGIALEGSAALTMYNGTVTGTKTPGSEDTWMNCGAAVVVKGDDVVATFNGGSLRSQGFAAIRKLKESGGTVSHDPNANNITLFTESIIKEQKSGFKSDFKVAKFTVNDIGYATLNEAVTAAVALSATQTATIMMGGDYDATVDGAISIDATGTVIFDGNGYELTIKDGADGITATSGNVTIKNVTISGNNGKTTGIVNNGANLTVGGNVTVRKFDYGVQTIISDAAVTTINDLYLPDSVNTGVKATKGETYIIMITDDCDTPVYADDTSLLFIRGGWFKRDVAKDSALATNPYYKVSTYVDAAQSHLKYIDEDKYYEVMFNNEPTVEIVSAEVLAKTDSAVYIAYNKGDATPIIFNFDAGCAQIDAVSKNAGKTVYPLFTSGLTDSKGNLTGTSGNVRIADQNILMNLPAGVYDLHFTFANGATITDKLYLQVYPRVAKVFEVPNTTEMSQLEAASVKEYISDDYLIDVYNVEDGHNFAVVMSEVPMKIAVGSNAKPYGDDVRNTNYIEYYLNDSAITANSWREIPANTESYGKYAGNKIFFISYADLNNLAAGQNYVFLDYGDSYYEIEKTTDMYTYKYFPFVLENTSVSISPSTVDWTSVSGAYANFTVKPDVLNESSVYIDGENVDKAYWTYDKDTHVLAIKSSYLNALDKKSHTLEVITSMGKVGATVNTKVGLMPKNLDYHVYGGGKSLSFVASDKINKDGGVWIGSSNPTKLDPSCYVWDSENGFTLSAAFLNRLALGTYYISAYVWDGTEYKYSTTSFKVISASQASYNPSTGDDSNIFIWLIVLALSAIAIVVIVLPKFKKQKAAEGADAEMVEDQKKDE